MKKLGNVADMGKSLEVDVRQTELFESARVIIRSIESNIKDPYSPEGFYKIFAAGFLPVPYLWGGIEEFSHARNWTTKPVRGSVKVVDKEGNAMKSGEVAEIAISNLKDAEYSLAQRQVPRKI